jgi:Zn-dependent peptidase ImmA (M78 family)
MTSVLRDLRDPIPLRALSLAEGLRLAERQANRLLKIMNVAVPPVPDTVITELPRIQVERIALGPVSGATEWSHGRWLILVNSTEPPGRQRFSLAHEFKHVLDHPFAATLYPDDRNRVDQHRAEQVCDHFAACLLMPRRLLEPRWEAGFRNPIALARLFRVSPTAMRFRLRATGLREAGAGYRSRNGREPSPR